MAWRYPAGPIVGPSGSWRLPRSPRAERSLGPDAPFYRALTPSWAHRPESGAGAALGGGRFNRPNVEARYLAATPEAALAEYQGESPLLPPATVATYQVTAEAVVDFTGGYNAEHQKGEIPNALDWLDTAYRLKDPGLAWLKVDFLLDPLGAEPRFLVIGRKLSFPE